ncbi:hypothetical protein [Levilactobacillus wangkuiensis]|uniref:hypothetical protein n=1 Tax=Levilactobacillus wangkuiensis TaxID=2799566 RepID=UPI00194EB853|nr:hypothetical protein [Levilactobacillus wangkuiensis]
MSKDKNEGLNVILDGLLPYFLASANCLTIGEVKSIDKGTPWLADVQPSPKQSDGNSRALLGGCLVAVPELKRGDSVIVGFVDRDTENYTGSGQFELASRRMHSINDGVVLGVIKSG